MAVSSVASSLGVLVSGDSVDKPSELELRAPSTAILLREPAKKLVHIDEDATADFDDRPVQTIGLAVKEQPPQATLRKGRVLLAELLDGQQFPLGVL